MTFESVKRRLSYLIPLFFVKLSMLCRYLRGREVLYLSVALPLQRMKPYNWGDDVSVVLTELISGKTVIPHQFAFFNEKKDNFLCIGSILQWYTNKNSVVWGSGLLENVGISAIPKKILAVRGPLTRAALLSQGIECPDVYGDPALLFPRYYKSEVSKEYKLGVICHFTELRDMELMAKFNTYVKDNKDVLFINISNYGRWNDFIDKVNSCEVIVSSSLHGVIISDAYRVPNIWVKFYEEETEKKDFKFQDYFLSVKKEVSEPQLFLFECPDFYVRLIKEVWTEPDINLDNLLEVCPFGGK